MRVVVVWIGVIFTAGLGLAAPPRFNTPKEDGTTTVSINEDEVPGKDVLTVKFQTPNCEVTGVTAIGQPNAVIKDGDFTVIGDRIVTAEPMDFETITFYKITVTAQDTVTLETSTVEFKLSILNTFDEDVTFSPPPHNFNVNEGDPSSFVGALSVSDADVGDTFTCTLTGTDASYFSVQETATTCEIYTAVALDYETHTTPMDGLVVQATDSGGKIATATVTVTLLDVNDNVPVCLPTPYSVSTLENTGSGGTATLVSLVCTDADSGVYGQINTYTIVDGDDASSKFAISGNNIVTTANMLDYEFKQVYVLKVEVVDNAPLLEQKTGTAIVMVTVLPENEFSPVFSPTSYSATVVEGTGISFSVQTVTATDDDDGSQGTVNYRISGGNVDGAFAIDSVTGEVTVTGVSPDRESVPIYYLEITAYDSFPVEDKTATATLTVTITDINDNPPKCSPSFYQASIMEPAGVGASILAMTAIDDDTAALTTFTYTIDSGDPTFYFKFISDSLYLQKEVDYETHQNYNLEISVSDGIYSSKCSATITILAFNEHIPDITVDNTTLNRDEDTAVGTIIYDVDANDLDTGYGGTSINFTIISGNVNNDFYCNPETGEVSVFNALDYDSDPKVYSLTIQAMDDGGNTDNMLLEVILLNINDETPTFTKNVYVVNVEEDEPIGTTVETVSAEDSDPGTDGTVTYRVVGGNGHPLFVVNSTTGAIYTNGTLDYEGQKRYSLVVEAVDGGGLTSRTEVDIRLEDMNDNPPVFHPSDYIEHLLETSAVDTSVSTVFATDADTKPDNIRFEYTLANNNFFKLDPTSGLVSLKAAVDRESQAQHVLTITAKDHGSPARQGTCTITVIILDVNDNDPAVVGTYTDVPVSEDAIPNTVVVQPTVTDLDDGDNARLTYSIVSGNTDDDFKISSTTGIIQVAKALDRERTASYSLVVKVHDNGVVTQKTTSFTVTINVEDENDHTPVWVGTLPYAFNVDENLTPGQTLGPVAATDDDTGNNAALTYSVDLFWVGNSAHFYLDETTGVITTTTSIDREQTPEYHARLSVTDKGQPQRRALVNVSIAVNDMNDNPPVFDKTLYNISFLENKPVGTGVLTVTVSDADTDLNDDITMSIDNGTAEGQRANNFFQVSNSGVVTINTLIDREMDSNFSFDLVAKNTASPFHSQTASVTVYVGDVNDNPPVFSPTFYNTEIAYTGVCKKNIVTVSATDADLGDNAVIEYFLNTTHYSETFQVDESSGQVSLTSGLSANSMHHVGVSARDKGNPSMTSTEPALVRVDALYPDAVVVTFKLGISVEALNAQLSTFLSQLQTRMRTQYSNAVARLWCAEANSDGLTDAHVYFLKSDLTNDVLNKLEAKSYITQAQARALFTSDADGTPNSAMEDTQWTPFAIQWIHPYYEKQTPWYETENGICILVAVGLLGLCLLALACYMCIRYCRVLARKRPRKPRKVIRPISVEERPPPVRTFQKLPEPSKAPLPGNFNTWTKPHNMLA